MVSNIPFIAGPMLPENRSLEPPSHGRNPSSEVFPMTRAQEGLWIAHSLAPHHTLYNVALKFTFSQDMKGRMVISAIDTLSRNHAMLRSTFHNANKNYAKPFVVEWDSNFDTTVLRIVTEPNGPQAKSKLQSLLRSAVDLSSNFAVRWVAVIGPAETESFMISHHIALDGGSMSQLSKQFIELLAIKTESNDLVAMGICPEPFYRAHMLEGAFHDSTEFESAKAFCVRQSTNVRPIKWVVPSLEVSLGKKNYRKIETWCEISNPELRDWGNCYITSWFRDAIALVEMLIRSIFEPNGEADHAITVAFGDRPVGMENSVGQFANALPIRVPLADVLSSQSPTFEALVKSILKEVSAAKKHDRFSYLDVVDSHRKLGLPVPSTQVAITLFPKLLQKERSLYPVEGPYDLFFCLLEFEKSISLGVIYDPLIFTSIDISLLKTQFLSLRMLTLPEKPLDISTLSTVKLHFPHMLPEFDAYNVDEIDWARFPIWFEHRASENPDLLAMHSAEQGRSVTYQELDEEANRKAYYLRKIGISPGSFVLLHLSRGFSMIKWIIAVLKSGGAFAVADQTHPALRTQSVISIAQPSLIIDDGNGRDLSKDASKPHRILDVSNLSFDDMPGDNLENVTQNEDLAYIVFTSRSTGKPKGVEIEHRNLSHFIANAYSSGYVSISPGSRVLQFATFSFDAAVLEWSQCLTLGGTLCFVDMPQALVGDYLADMIDENEISFVHLTPSVLATLPTSRAFPSLQQISVGGEMVPENLIKTWRTRVQVQNAYGPTECTVVMSHHPQSFLFFATCFNSNPSTSSPSNLSFYPGSPFEVPMISQMWKDVLELSQLPSPSDKFFDLGGNSMAIQNLAKSLKSPFPLTNLRVMNFFSHATIVAQAGLVSDGREFTYRKRSDYPSTPPSDVLGIKIQDDTSLFAAGLESQGQMLLMHRLAKAIPSAVLPTTAFFDANYTPASLSLCLKKYYIGVEELPPYLTVLQSGDTSVLYLLIAPAGGSCASYLDLSQHLSSSATIVALEHPNFASSHSSIDSNLNRYSVNDLGKLYANDVKRLFKTMKECVLIGASFGGLVAVELDRHISDAGILVKSLSLLDSPWPNSESVVNALTPTSVISNLFLFGDAARDALFQHSHITDRLPSDIPSQCASMISAVTDALSHASSEDREVFERYNWRLLIRVYIDNVHTLREFFFSQDLRVGMPVLYFRATLNETSAGVDLWKEAIPNLSVHDIEAHHASLYSGVNAKKVSRLISDSSF